MERLREITDHLAEMGRLVKALDELDGEVATVAARLDELSEEREDAELGKLAATLWMVLS